MKKYSVLWGVILLLLPLVNCQDKSYLIDEGIHSPYFEGSVLDYLRSRPDYFSTLVEVIEYAGMEDLFSGTQPFTFFAPTDHSIEKSMEKLHQQWYVNYAKDSVTDIHQVAPEVWEEFLSLYILKDKYLLKDIPQIDTTSLYAYGGQAYLSWGGVPMNVGVLYYDEKGIKYAGYRQLLYSYVYDFVEKEMVNAYVATSDIQPQNGIVHVLRFKEHSFGFNSMDFVNKAITAGIRIIEKEEDEK